MKKETVIKRLQQAREKILKQIELLPEEKWDEVFLGEWNLKDFVAHLIGWDTEGLKATQEIIKGKLPRYYQYYERNWTKINKKLVRKYKKGKKKDLLSRVKKSHQKLVKELEKILEELYNKDFGVRWKGSKITLASDTLYQADDEEIHAQQIKCWLKSGQRQ